MLWRQLLLLLQVYRSMVPGSSAADLPASAALGIAAGVAAPGVPGAAAKPAAKLTQKELEAIMLGSSGDRAPRPAVATQLAAQAKQAAMPPAAASVAPPVAPPALRFATAVAPVTSGSVSTVPTPGQPQMLQMPSQLKNLVVAGGHEALHQPAVPSLVALQHQSLPPPLQKPAISPPVLHVVQQQQQQAPPVPQALSSVLPQTGVQSMSTLCLCVR